VNNELVAIGDFKEETGEKITKEKLSNANIDGIFAASDLMAVGAMKALKQMNVNKPVIGFDDIPLASSFQPSLTTVRQPIEKVGYQAAEKIVKLIDKGSAESTVLDVELLIRESTRFYHEDS
jgi:DNA-binding LacI/PurR family transcriptional regulator